MNSSRVLETLTDAVETKRVMVIPGSPRRAGNSATLAARIARGAEATHAKVKPAFLQGLEVSPCSGCDTCQKPDSKVCAIKDGMQEVYGSLISADTCVIASRVYWSTMSARTKVFVHRRCALPAYAENRFAGKRIAIAMSYGDADPVRSGCVSALGLDCHLHVGTWMAAT